MSDGKRLYDEIIDITEEYLGPAAQRFIDRQIESHLQKSPDELVPEDVAKLIEWSGLAFAHLTDNRSLIQQFTDSLERLAQQRQAA